MGQFLFATVITVKENDHVA
ncbi:membrane protein YoeI [Escherichia coli]